MNDIGILVPLQPKHKLLLPTTLVLISSIVYINYIIVVHVSIYFYLIFFSFSLDKFVSYSQTSVQVKIKSEFVKNPDSWAQVF